MIAFNGEIDAAVALGAFARLAECGCVPEGTSKGHRDGWGIAVWDGSEGAPVVHKSVLAANDDPLYAETAARIVATRPTFVMAHLRKASVGGPSLANTHPFMEGRFAFCHNGSIFGNEKVVFIPAFEEKVWGATDSERFFLSMMQDLGPMSGEADIDEAIVRSMQSVRTACDYYSLTSLLCDGHGIWAVREVNEENAVVRENADIGYYTLYAGEKDGEECIVSSEKTDLPGVTWREIPNHTTCRLRLQEAESAVRESVGGGAQVAMV